MPSHSPAPRTKSAPLAAQRALERVRKICLALPGAEEKISHGAPLFHVPRGKSFVMFANDHHGDGRLAIWCRAPVGAQGILVDSDPDRFFIPPYVGVSGWVGVRLDRVPARWDAVSAIIEDGFRIASPPLRTSSRRRVGRPR